jgi:hypothetical protein
VSRHPYADAAAHLDEAQLDTVLSALDDAADYRWLSAQASCEHCRRLDPAQCADHARDEELSDRYSAVAQQLRQEADKS